MVTVLQHPRRRTRRQTKERKGKKGKKLITAHDIYQLLVGEIGIPRREFLYDLRFWEIRRIIRGYRNRDKLKLQMMAECVYASMFTMRDPKGKTVKDMFPMLFDDDEEDEPTASISDEDREDLTALIRNLNQRNTQPQTDKKE